MNKDKFSWFLNKFFFIHPVAIALIFIINSFELVKYNKSISTIEVLFSVILTLLILLLNYLLFKKLLNNNFKAAILASVFQVFCLFYWYIFTLSNSVNLMQLIVKFAFFGHQTIALLVIFLFLSILLTVYLKRSNANLIKFNWFLNALSIIFLFMTLIQTIQTNNINITLKNRDKITKSKVDRQTPNIYYIILDSYTGNNSLKKYWNFDNYDFTNFLKNKGFYIAKSNSNYNWTPFSLSSSLNMSYLDMHRNNDISNEHFNQLLKLIKSSKVIDFLKNNGYKIINYSFFDVSNQSKFYRDYFFLTDNFFSKSIFSLLYYKISYLLKADEINNLPTDNLSVINKVKNLIPNGNGRFFVYTHLLLPHPPYVFDRNGKQNPIQYDDYDNKTKYLEQLRFTNKLITDCIDNILRNSKSTPIIIIQGDHGFRYLKNEDQLTESFTILNAYFFPDKDYKLLYDTISPVNSFRVVFNKYFHSNIPLLKDTSLNVLPKNIFTR